MKEIKFPENAKLYSIMKKFGERIVVEKTEIPEGAKFKFITLTITQKEIEDNLRPIFEILKKIPERLIAGLTILAKIIVRMEQEKRKS